MPSILPAVVVAALALASARAEAETCFHACLKTKLVSPSLQDTSIRGFMKDCRDTCQARSLAELVAKGLDKKIAACVPERLAESDVKKLRSASASVVAYANAFTWDVHNVLTGSVIRRVELTTLNQNMDNLTVSGAVTALPGETQTVVIAGVFDGYPGLRMATRIGAVFACPL
jgi:hypothetical protein